MIFRRHPEASRSRAAVLPPVTAPAPGAPTQLSVEFVLQLRRELDRLSIRNGRELDRHGSAS